MSNYSINENRLTFLIKPLDLFLKHDVQADEQTKVLIKKEWEESGYYYVAELLTSTGAVSFINVHIALREMGFSPSQLSKLEYILPRVAYNRQDKYESIKPQICQVLGMHADLWSLESSEFCVISSDSTKPDRLFNIHFKESDLQAEGMDIKKAEQLFEDTAFLSEFSDLIRSHALRLSECDSSNRRLD